MTQIRRCLSTLAAALVLAALAPVTAARAVPAITFYGAGWGHGVGMSQYGAYGMAAEGKSWTDILAHYFTGTSVAQASMGDIRVGVAQGGEVSVSPQAIAGGGGAAAFSVPWGVVSMSPGQTWRFRPAGGGAVTIVPPVGGPVSTPSALAITWDASKTALANAVTGTRYRWGIMWMTSPPGATTQVAAVNQLALDPYYLYGIAEVPSTFPADALLAQATAARSFALDKVRAGVRSACDCHVYSDTRDQNFTGWEKLAAPGNGPWQSAVDLTSRWVVAYGGASVATYYFSSSGGRTENIEDMWGGEALPWLRSVDDHWSLLPSNPHRSWTKDFPADQAAAAVGLDVLWAVDVSDRTVGGTVRTATFVGLRGGALQRTTITGSDMMTRFGLLGRRVNSVSVPGSPLSADLSTYCTARPDFAGDDSPELTVFSPSTATWTVAGVRSGTFGKPTDVACPGDYTGDGVADFATFDRLAGTWSVEGAGNVAYGAPGDQPVPHNYNGDTGGAYEMAVFRQSTGTWFVRFMYDGGIAFGGPGDVAVPTDFDGDLRADLTIFRPSAGTWFVRGIAPAGVAFGASGDVPLPADFTGDGRSEIAVYRPATGTWYVAGLAEGGIPFGAPGDVPVLADYDGDHVADLAVFRPSTATWYVRRIAPGGVQFGAPGDTPLMRWR